MMDGIVNPVVLKPLTFGALAAGPALMYTVTPAPPTSQAACGSAVRLERTQPGGTGGAPPSAARICPVPLSTTSVDEPRLRAVPVRPSESV